MNQITNAFVGDDPHINEGGAARKIIIVGEAPGWQEQKQGQPFVGPAGHELSKWWKEVGLGRGQMFITNVYPYKFPGKNDITKVPMEEFERWTIELHEKLAAMGDPYIIVPTGDTALKACMRMPILMKTAKGVIKTTPGMITKWRGSLLTYTDNAGRVVKMIPTNHPAAVLRMPSLTMRCISDYRKIAHEATFKGLDSLPTLYHKTRPSLKEIAEFRDHVVNNPETVMSLDIETHPKSGITCIGFAAHPNYSFVVPLGKKRLVQGSKRKADPTLKDRVHQHWVQAIAFAENHPEYPMMGDDWWKKTQQNALDKFHGEGKVYKAIKTAVEKWADNYGEKDQIGIEPQKSTMVTIGYWGSDEDAAKALELVKEIVEAKCPKVMQNGFYDEYWLWLYGIKVENYAWDTMSMHHCLNANDEHSLHYMASLDTMQPYWKDECKEPGEVEKYASNSDALWEYNGLDNTGTLQLFYVYHAKLLEAGRLDFYERHYRAMQEPLMAMTQHGIRVDADKVKELKEKFQAQLDQAIAQVSTHAGKDLTSKKKISPKKLMDYFYNDLRLPQQTRKRGKGERTASVDEVAVRTLMLKFPDKIGKVGEAYLRSQRNAQLLAFLKESHFDTDGRFRALYKFTTKAGRLASSKNPAGTGANAQNQDREIRDIFVADEGKFIMEIDLSQAESRDVYMRTGDIDLIREAQSVPWEHDMHTSNAEKIFRQTGHLLPGQTVTKSQRYLGKKAVHGAQRNMRGPRLADEIMKETGSEVIITPEEGDAMIRAYFDSKPAIVGVYFNDTGKEVRRARMLTNLWGREIRWPYQRFDDELYREAFSFYPQSDIADLLNQWGLVPLYNVLKTHNMATKLHTQRHDALIMSTDLTEGWWLMCRLAEWLQQPIQYPCGEWLSVPVTVKIGKSDGEGHEWKQLPSEQEFNKVAAGLLAPSIEAA